MKTPDTDEGHEQNLNEEFDLLYQSKYRKLSSLHWTSYEITLEAISWLALSPKSKILDIGSGVGKFCILGALFSNAHFTGVEKRNDLVKESRTVRDTVNAKNAEFIHANIAEIDFSKFDGFYYYNPFYEHLVDFGRIDKSITFSKKKFDVYERYVFNQLNLCPPGTRIVTYCSDNFFLPNQFFLHKIKHNGRLLFWEKTK